MGWHCITVWECELRKDLRDRTLESLVMILKGIHAQEHGTRCGCDPDGVTGAGQSR
jgi:DNA mismatch endonuclease (patch repair protein)